MPTAFRPDLPVLPVATVLPALADSLGTAPNAVLVAPPGAGKTTLVPLALLGASWRGDGRILVLEPRRIATRAAAARMASLRGEAVGGVVGYRTRLDAAVSAATRVEVITEGLLVRRLQSDPGLEGVAAVVFDEVHERALDSDLALAFCLDLQRALRPELRLLAMSATAEAARLAALMQAPVIESHGRAHPVEIRHAARDLADPRDLPAALARAVCAALADHEGDVLAFLPGMGEIRRAQAALAAAAPGVEVLALHGDLPASAQDLALNPGVRRRVVLASSIAETSLTVPGVRIVVDGGFRRVPERDAGTGLTRLATRRISRASATQRAGRAGREGPGVAIRLWSEALHRGLAEFDPPEILQADLSGFALDCAAWGADPVALPLPDPPPAGALAAARALLVGLGALDAEARITAAGREMAGLGAHPRLAAMMRSASGPPEQALAADLAALLEERDPLRGPDQPADISLRLAALAEGAPEADRGTLARIREAARRYRRRLGVQATTAAAGDPGALLAAAFPDRVAQNRGEAGSFRLAGGGGARLPVIDPLARAPFLVAAVITQTGAARIRLAATLDPANLPAARLTESVESGLDPVTGSVLTRRRKRLGALVLEDRTERAPAALAVAAIVAHVQRAPASLPWSDAARALQARVALLARLEPGAWPDLSDASLAAGAAEWLPAWLPGAEGLGALARLDMARLLDSFLDHRARARLERELPAALALPGGRAAIDYIQEIPVAAARAQAFYGLATTPTLAGGRVALRLALLSPAGRPVAITADLAGFWRGAWAEVRREMRGRYPKHRWPEDPSVPSA